MAARHNAAAAILEQDAPKDAFSKLPLEQLRDVLNDDPDKYLPAEVQCQASKQHRYEISATPEVLGVVFHIPTKDSEGYSATLSEIDYFHERYDCCKRWSL